MYQFYWSINCIRAFLKPDQLFSLGNVDNLSPKKIAANTELSGYKNGEAI